MPEMWAFNPRDRSKDVTLSPENAHPVGTIVVNGILWVGDIGDERPMPTTGPPWNAYRTGISS